LSIADGNFFADVCPNCGYKIVQRTVPQNRAMMGIGEDCAKQLCWPLDSGERMEAEDWVDMLLAAFERAHGRRSKVVPAPDGSGFHVIFRKKKSRLSKQEASEFLEYFSAWAIDNGVHLNGNFSQSEAFGLRP